MRKEIRLRLRGVNEATDMVAQAQWHLERARYLLARMDADFSFDLAGEADGNAGERHDVAAEMDDLEAVAGPISRMRPETWSRLRLVVDSELERTGHMPGEADLKLLI